MLKITPAPALNCNCVFFFTFGIQILHYEAVHSMSGWVDLKRRLAPDRRCYMYTHRSMPGEPVVVLHTALEYEIADNIQVCCHDRSRFSCD